MNHNLKSLITDPRLLNEQGKNTYIKQIITIDTVIDYPHPITLHTALKHCLKDQITPKELVLINNHIIVYEENPQRMALKINNINNANLLQDLASFNIQTNGKNLTYQNKTLIYTEKDQIFLEKTQSQQINNVALSYLNTLTNSYYYIEGDNLYKDNILVFTFTAYSPRCNISFMEEDNWKLIHEAYILNKEKDDFFAFIDKKAS